MFTDGAWRHVEVIARCRRRDGWLVLLRWHDPVPDERWYKYDPARFRDRQAGEGARS